MNFQDFETIMSEPRMGRYMAASGYNTRKAMTLYRWNLKLSQELFTVISCYEIALRNAINKHCLSVHGDNWLRNSAVPGGIFDTVSCQHTRETINDAVIRLNTDYTHNKLVAELGFGFWRYLFASHQYLVMGKTLLAIFPAKPTSSALQQYNQKYIFNQLRRINVLRNRIAHHEPICFAHKIGMKDTSYVRHHYLLIRELFLWMNIDEAALLYGIDHVHGICGQIDAL